MNEDENKPITFEINKYGWVLLFRKLGSKIILRAENIRKKNERVHDESGHRMDEAEAEGGAKVRPKLVWDISKFT